MTLLKICKLLKTIFVVLLFLILFSIATTIASSAQTFSTLRSFDGNNGANSYSSLIQFTDGNFYGTTSIGGTSANCSGGCGTVFKIDAAGALAVLHNFQGTDGQSPWSGLVHATDGNFYGTTSSGGSSTNCFGGCGTIYRISAAGAFTTLHSFQGSDGQWPYAGLIQATDGNLYGVTLDGGAYDNCTFSPGCGTVFQITLGGTLATLHSFASTDGGNPWGGLIQASDGNLYGTTQFGGANNACGTSVGCGTVFSITSAGALTTLYNFCSQTGCKDGAVPSNKLVQGTDGKFYGTTYGGGISAFGTVFAITATGSFRTLHRFIGQDGFAPSGLIEGADGNYYGTAEFGGNSHCPDDCGTIFEISTRGVMTTLHHFRGTDGANPYSGLMQTSNGTFYGPTLYGGRDGDGTIFSLSLSAGARSSVESHIRPYASLP